MTPVTRLLRLKKMKIVTSLMRVPHAEMVRKTRLTALRLVLRQLVTFNGMVAGDGETTAAKAALLVCWMLTCQWLRRAGQRAAATGSRPAIGERPSRQSTATGKSWLSASAAMLTIAAMCETRSLAWQAATAGISSRRQVS